MTTATTTAVRWPRKLRYVSSVLLPILPLDRLHLVFKPKLQFLEPDFFQLFIFTEVALLGKRIKTGGILHVLLSQLSKFIMIGQKSVIRSQHPGRPPIGDFLASNYHSPKIGSMPNSGAVSL